MADLKFFKDLSKKVEELKVEGLYKEERRISSPQGSHIVSEGKEVINFCANNYLGFSNEKRLIDVSKNALDNFGFGLSSVRFICGTQSIHKELEKKVSEFLQTEDTLLYSSCFDANGGLFETLLGPEDAIISDSLNHASIIDGIRLCRAERFRYENNDMADLEKQLKEADKFRYKLIATDGVFSMDGIIANLRKICDLADQYGALVMVDDSHAVGFLGEHGRGTPEYCGVMDRIDILTGTFGKALGGALGGYTSGRKEIIEWLRQRSRPYLFSNSLAPNIVASTIEAIQMVSESSERRKKLWHNTQYFREKMAEKGFVIVPGTHPIVPIMLGEATLAKQMATQLFDEGIYVIGFSYPVVPKGRARIRVQISAAHLEDDLKKAISAFEKVGKNLGVI